MDYPAEWDKLSKYERRQKIKALNLKQQVKGEQLARIKKWLLWFLVLAVLGWLFYRQSTKPLSGELMPDQGREHVADISEFGYNSNPPTSGPHYPEWTRRGVFNEPLNDGNLIHSLEHGYVIVSYNCEQLPLVSRRLINSAWAHEGEDDVPAGKPHPATAAASLDESQWQSANCDELRSTLSQFFEANKGLKLIIVPRPGLDVPVALTAWNRILKLNTWDEVQAENFLKAWHNKGPERTVE